MQRILVEPERIFGQANYVATRCKTCNGLTRVMRYPNKTIHLRTSLLVATFTSFATGLIVFLACKL